MTSINRLTANPSVESEDSFPIWDDANERTRRVTGETLTTYITEKNIKSAAIVNGHLILILNDDSQVDCGLLATSGMLIDAVGIDDPESIGQLTFDENFTVSVEGFNGAISLSSDAIANVNVNDNPTSNIATGDHIFTEYDPETRITTIDALGGGTIAEDMYFTTILERDAWTNDNPTRFYQGITCGVENLTDPDCPAYDYYQWFVTGAEWMDANLLYQGKKGDQGDKSDIDIYVDNEFVATTFDFDFGNQLTAEVIDGRAAIDVVRHVSDNSIFFSSTGDDANDGLDSGNAKLTLQACISAVNALDPAPAADYRVSIVCTDPATYDVISITIPDFTSIYAPLSTFNTPPELGGGRVFGFGAGCYLDAYAVTTTIALPLDFTNASDCSCHVDHVVTSNIGIAFGGTGTNNVAYVDSLDINSTPYHDGVYCLPSQAGTVNTVNLGNVRMSGLYNHLVLFTSDFDSILNVNLNSYVPTVAEGVSRCIYTSGSAGVLNITAQSAHAVELVRSESTGGEINLSIASAGGGFANADYQDQRVNCRIIAFDGVKPIDNGFINGVIGETRYGTAKIRGSSDARTIYFSKGGDDASDGLDVNHAKLTLQSCIDTVNSLNPTPSADNRATITCVDSGDYDVHSIAIPDFTSLSAPFATFNAPPTAGAVLALGNGCNLDVFTIITTIAIALHADDANDCICSVGHISSSSASVGITGSSNNNFITVDDIDINATPYIPGLYYIPSAETVNTVNFGSVKINGDYNCLVFSDSDFDSILNLNFNSAVYPAGANNVRLVHATGSAGVLNVTGQSAHANELVRSESTGGEVNLFITSASGALANPDYQNQRVNCRILEFDGEKPADNGFINGVIGEVRYGTAKITPDPVAGRVLMGDQSGGSEWVPSGSVFSVDNSALGTLSLPSVSASDLLNITPSAFVEHPSSAVGTATVLRTDLIYDGIDNALSKITESFDSVLYPEESSEGYVHDSNPVDGYGVNKVITYFNPTAGDESNPQPAYPDVTTMGKFCAIHEYTNASTVWFMIHESGMDDITGESSSGKIGIPLLFKGQQFALGLSGKPAPANSIWNLEGRSVSDQSDPNLHGDDTQYTDGNGDNVDGKADSYTGTYSNGGGSQVGSIVFNRGGYSYLSDGEITTFIKDSGSEWFGARVKMGGGGFGQKKVMMVFPQKFDPATIEAYDTPADAVGAEIEALQESVDSIHSEYPSNTEFNNKSGFNKVISGGGSTLDMSYDRNGAVVSNTAQYVNFKLLQGLNGDDKTAAYVRYVNAGTNNASLSFYDRDGNKTTAYGMPDHCPSGAVIEAWCNYAQNRYFLAISTSNMDSISALQSIISTIETTDSATTQLTLSEHPVTDVKALEFTLYIEACGDVQKRTTTILKEGSSWNVYRDRKGHDFTQLDLVLNESASTSHLVFDLIGTGSGEDITLKYHVKREM